MAQKINPISMRLNLNCNINFRDYFDLIRPPMEKMFGFYLGHSFVYFFLNRLSRSRYIGLRATQLVELIRHIDDTTEKQQNEVSKYGFYIFNIKKGQVVLYPKHIKFCKYQKGRFKGCKANAIEVARCSINKEF
uniref:Uncharacterized protein n=1 Tax=Physcomitrium patens TaxID=3218 RepID=A0A2K1IMB0_PHYPA|nr:hypothetical protein PHYPA_026725 [Physcomitrium patens]